MRIKNNRLYSILCSAFLAVQCIGVAPLPPRVDYPESGENDSQDDVFEFVEAPDDPSDDIVGSWNYAALKDMGHPRLFMSETDFEELRTKVTTDRNENSFLYKIHNAIIRRADELLVKPDEISETLDASGRRLLPMSKKALDGIWHHSYAYKTTGDKKYLAAAKKILSNVCGFSYWTNRTAPHYLDVGEMTLAVAIAYDWLYYDLTLEERTKAHQCIRDFALDTYKTNGFHKEGSTSSISNWNQVCFCGLGCAAITLYEKDKQRCADLLELLIPSNKRAMEHMYKPNGIYPEGYTYWSYGTGMQTVLLTALEHAFGTTNGLEDVEGFMETGEYMLFMAGPAGYVFSYSDAAADAEYGKVAMWYFAAKKNDLSLLANEVRLFDKLKKYPGDQFSRILPVVPAMTKHVTLGDISQNMPKKEMLVSNSPEEPTHLMMIHTGWKFNADDKYVGFKGGSPDYSHGHMDVGSFVYDAYGQRWSHDPGMETYTTMESKLGITDTWRYDNGSPRWTVFRLSNKAHSTMIINNAEQNVAGKGIITENINENAVKGANMDLTTIYSAQAKSVMRQVRLVGEDLVISDVIETLPDKPAEIQWRMLTPAAVYPEKNLKRERLVSGGKTIYLKAEASDSGVVPEYTTWKASGNYDWEASNKGMTVAGYTCVIPKGKKVTLTTRLTKNE